MLGPACEVLDQLRSEFEQQGSYQQANQVMRKIRQIHQLEETRLCEDVYTRQSAALAMMDEAHAKEMELVIEQWGHKVKEYEGQAAKVTEALTKRQAAELDLFTSKLETMPGTPRWSPYLLHLRKVEQRLARQRDYTQASTYKAEADEMQVQEQQAWAKARAAKIGAGLQQFVHKQELELEGLQKRIASGRQDQQSARSRELNRLRRRYLCARRELEMQQRIASTQVERNPLANYHKAKRKLSAPPILRGDAA